MENLFRVGTKLGTQTDDTTKKYVWLRQKKKLETEKHEKKTRDSFVYKNLHSLNTIGDFGVGVFISILFVLWVSRLFRLLLTAYCCRLIFCFFHLVLFLFFFALNKNRPTPNKRLTHKTNKTIWTNFQFLKMCIVLFIVEMKLLSILPSGSVPTPCVLTRRNTLKN